MIADIKGYEGRYKVTDDGRVFDKDSKEKPQYLIKLGIRKRGDING